MIFTEISILPEVIEGDELGIQTLDHSTPKPELLYHYDKYRKTKNAAGASTIRNKTDKKTAFSKRMGKGFGTLLVSIILLLKKRRRVMD